MSAVHRPRPAGLPFPSWPVWLVFGLLLVPSIAVLGFLGLSKDVDADQLALQRDAVGRSAVLTGTLSDVETTSGLPKTTSIYDVTIPESETGADAGSTVSFRGPEQWGFPPSKDYPAERDFLVVFDDGPRSVADGPVGTLDAVTEQTVRDAEQGFVMSQAVWALGIVVFWLFALGLPALAIVLAVRRHRAKRRLRGL